MVERNKKVTFTGDKNGNWKGDNAGYNSIHQWVRRKFGKAKKCVTCDSEKNVQWSNLDKKYKRDISTWAQKCSSCHQKYDKSVLKNTPLPFVKGNRSIRIPEALLNTL